MSRGEAHPEKLARLRVEVGAHGVWVKVENLGSLSDRHVSFLAHLGLSLLGILGILDLIMTLDRLHVERVSGLSLIFGILGILGKVGHSRRAVAWYLS